MKDFFSILLHFAIVVIVVFLLGLFRVFGIHYVRIVKNNSLRNEASVTRIDDEQIEFADARKMKVLGGIDPNLKTEILNSGNLVGLDVDQGYATLFVKRPQFICGLGRPQFIFPIIPVDVPAYASRAVIFGTIDEN